MLIDNLRKMSRDELVQFADSQGVKAHWKANPETIIVNIMSKLGTPTMAKSKADESPEEKIARLKQERTVHNSVEDVEALLEKKKAKQPALEWRFDGDVLTVRCKGAENCMNINQSLKIIERAIDLHVMRGALRPRALDNRDWSPISTSYSNTVLV